MQERLQNKNYKKWIYLQLALAAFYLLTNMLVPTTMGFMKPLHFGMRKYLMIAMILIYLYICRLEYSAEIWLAGLYWVWLVASRFLINGVSSVKADASLIADNIFGILLLGLGRMMNREERLCFMDIISSAIALFTTVCSLIGIWCGITRQTLYTADGSLLCKITDLKRIDNFGVNPNVCGLWFVLGFMLLVYLFFRYKKLRWLTVTAAVLNYIAAGLSYSRNAHLAFASCAALLAMLWLRPRLSKISVRRRAAVLAVIFIAVIPVAYKSFSLTHLAAGATAKVLYVVSAGTAGYAEEAPAEAEQEMSIEAGDAPDGEQEVDHIGAADFTDHRGLSDSGRTEIWLTAIDTIRMEPIRLLRGCENEHVMDYSNQLLPKDYNHYHSSPIQILMTTGIPGLLIAAALMLMICIKALKLFLSGKAETSEKMLVLPALAAFQYSMLECLIYYYTILVPLTFFLVAGIVTQTWDDIKKER